jgi:hypothetical protein
MKNLVLGIGSFLIITAVILIAFTFHGKSMREEELSNALSSALEKSMELLSAEPGTRPENQEEWLVCFLEVCMEQIDSQSEVIIRILDADYEKGLLSVEGLMKYRHPIGSEGNIAIQKTMLIEQYEKGVT